MPNRKRNSDGEFTDNRKRNSDGQFASEGMTGPVRDHPWASAAIAAGAAAAGAFLWSKRGRIGDKLNSGMDRLSELKNERMGSSERRQSTSSGRRQSRAQSNIADEAISREQAGQPSSIEPSMASSQSKAATPAHS